MAAIFVESAKEFEEQVLEDGVWGSPFTLDHELSIYPGALYRWDTIVAGGTSLKQLCGVHIELLVAFVRDNKGDPWSPRLLSQVYPGFALYDFLFTPWIDQTNEDVARLLNLSMDEFIKSGMTRKHVKRRWWRFSVWRSLFKLDSTHVTTLGIEDPLIYFPCYSEDVHHAATENSLSAPLLRLNL